MTRYTRAELEAMSEPHLRQVALNVIPEPSWRHYAVRDWRFAKDAIIDLIRGQERDNAESLPNE